MRVPRPLRWLLWPATVAHELTHALVAVVLRCEVHTVSLFGRPHVRYSAPQGRQDVAAVVNIAPLVCGLLAALWATWSGADADLAAASPIAWGVVTLWWVRYVIPSVDDVAPLLLLARGLRQPDV